MCQPPQSSWFSDFPNSFGLPPQPQSYPLIEQPSNDSGYSFWEICCLSKDERFQRVWHFPSWAIESHRGYKALPSPIPSLCSSTCIRCWTFDLKKKKKDIPRRAGSGVDTPRSPDINDHSSGSELHPLCREGLKVKEMLRRKKTWQFAVSLFKQKGRKAYAF